jgi:hypothetical protein
MTRIGTTTPLGHMTSLPRVKALSADGDDN